MVDDRQPHAVAGEAWSIITEHADGSATLRHFAPPPEALRARLLAVLGEPMMEHMITADEWAAAKTQQMGVLVAREGVPD